MSVHVKRKERPAHTSILRTTFIEFPPCPVAYRSFRSDLDGVSRSAMSASASATGGAVGSTGGDSARPIVEEQEAGGQGAGSSGFRSGLMIEGDSNAFGPLGQIEENGGGGVEDMELEHDGSAASRPQQVRLMDVYTAAMFFVG